MIVTETLSRPYRTAEQAQLDLIAKIPEPLSRHVARAFYPAEYAAAAAAYRVTELQQAEGPVISVTT